MKLLSRLILTGYLAAGAGCNFIPPRQAPGMEIPPHFKEGGGWKIANPSAQVPRGEWWSIFGDRELSSILRSVNVSNQSLQSAAAVAEQTAALLKSARLSFFPTAGIDAAGTRSKSGSGGTATSNSSQGTTTQKPRTRPPRAYSGKDAQPAARDQNR